MNKPKPTRLEQLQRALAAGLIDQDTFDAAVGAMDAQVVGSGAVAQGPDAVAAGAGGVAMRGDNEGIINLGLLIQQGAKPGASREEIRQIHDAKG